MTKVTSPPQLPLHEPPSGMNWFRRMFRGFLAILGLLLIVIGVVIGIATPGLPFGIVPGIIGVILLGTNSSTGRNWMEGVLEKRPWLERIAPHWLMRMVFNREKRDPEVLKGKKKPASDGAKS